MIEVLHAGMLSSLQDHGRIGHAHLGIGRSGAADRPARMLANALVGNDDAACVIEATLVGPRLRIRQAAWIALTGAPLPRACLDGRPLPMWRPVRCAAGAEIDLGPMPSGCRSYLAVEGGIAAETWLGSRSSDLNAGLGPLQGRALRAGDVLPLGKPERAPAYAGHWSLDPAPWFDASVGAPLRLMPASHTDRLEPASRDALGGAAAFRVDADSNRVGVRMQGPAPLRLDEPRQLLSEGLVAGSMQLPPGGQPILMLAEHPVTGGYPRIAQLAEVDLPRLAQLRPGDTTRFEWIETDTARDAWQARERELLQICTMIRTRLEHGT